MESNSSLGPILMVVALFESFVILPLIVFKGRGRAKGIVAVALLLGSIVLFAMGFMLWRGLIGHGH